MQSVGEGPLEIWDGGWGWGGEVVVKQDRMKSDRGTNGTMEDGNLMRSPRKVKEQATKAIAIGGTSKNVTLQCD